MTYVPNDDRYNRLPQHRCGQSGLYLPAISLGLWQNFGEKGVFETARAMVRTAFDLGITHFDLANNYGEPPGSAEKTFGRILRNDLAGYRDELIISTKAGYRMWPGPHGDGGSRKYLLASLDQSLQRLGLDYVDVFYHHRPDDDTPLRESMRALDQAVRSGKALYVGLSNYGPEATRKATTILDELGTPRVLHQPKYNMFERSPERGLFAAMRDTGLGGIVFSPLAQGLLTDKYLGDVPDDARITKTHSELHESDLTPERVKQIRRLNEIAESRGQSLAQLALAWVLRRPEVTSALVGASRPEQIEENVAALDAPPLSEEEQDAVEDVLLDGA